MRHQQIHDLTTPLPGSTPDAVVLSGVWDAGETAAALAWTAVTDNKVINLQLRATAGPEFDPDDETIIADFAPDTAPRETLQTFGLAIPGAAASFKMYALTAEGNQKGSNEVSVERPVSA